MRGKVLPPHSINPSYALDDYQVLNVSVLYMIYLMCLNALCYFSLSFSQSFEKLAYTFATNELNLL